MAPIDQHVDAHKSDPGTQLNSAETDQLQKKDLDMKFNWSVQNLVGDGLREVPKEYVQPARKGLDFPVDYGDERTDIPVINFAKIKAADSEEVSKFFHACEDWGFFQLASHGIPEELILKTQCLAREFFNLSLEDKSKYVAQNPDSILRGYGRMNYHAEEGLADWGDCLAFDDSDADIPYWPTKPEPFRETYLLYCQTIRRLGLELLSILACSLGLPANYVENNFGPLKLLFALNLYPRCPQPDLVIGASAHADYQFITLLHQNEVPGLQVLRGERWIVVKPRPNHLVVNLGDQLEIMSNGKYKSCIHRVMANKGSDRLSIIGFLEPAPHAVIGPAMEIVDESHPAKYQTIKFKDYAQHLVDQGFLGKRGVDSLKVPS